MKQDHYRRKIKYHYNLDDIYTLKEYLNKEIKKQISEIGRMFITQKKKDETIKELSEYLTTIQKINSLSELKEFVNDRILTLFTIGTTNKTSSAQQTQMQFSEGQLEIDYQNNSQKNQESDQKDTPKENEYNEYENKRQIIESIKKRTTIKENQRNAIGEMGKKIHIDLIYRQFDFFIPNKKVKIDDYLNRQEYSLRREQSTSPKGLGNLLYGIKQYFKSFNIDIDTEYNNKDIDYYDYIRHSDSEAGKIAAEIMQLNGSYFINIEKDNPEIDFDGRIRRTEAYTLMSFRNCFHLRRFRINGDNHEVERHVLMEGN